MFRRVRVRHRKNPSSQKPAISKSNCTLAYIAYPPYLPHQHIGSHAIVGFRVGRYFPSARSMSNYCRGLLITLTPEPLSSSPTPTIFTKTLNIAIVEKTTVGEVACPRYNQLAVNALKTISCRDTCAQIS
jgi:hypothetical protein